MDYRTSQLVAKINATNQANCVANLWRGKLRAFFSFYVGKKILKADGSFIVGVQKSVDKLGLPDDRNVRIYYDRQNKYSLCFTVKVCEQTPSYDGDKGYSNCVYESATIVVGELGRDSGVLEKLREFSSDEKLREDYNLAEVLALQAELKAAEDVVSEIQGKLFPFAKD